MHTPSPQNEGKITLVLDLDETLVHSSFKRPEKVPDYNIPIEINGEFHDIYVLKRPYVEQFLNEMC